MSSARPPSSYKVLLAANELAALRETLIAIDPSIEEDQTLFADMLEGEGGDALEVIERLIEASIDADLLADLVKARIDAMKERMARFERRRDTYRAGALQVLERINLRKLERPTFSAGLRNLPPKVVITNVNDLADRYVVIERKPRKHEIGVDLNAGQAVQGAELSNGGVGLTVRTK